MSQSSAAPPNCARHEDHVAVARCRDCGQPLCARCTVDLPELGSFCWACAARRGGLRARRKARAEPEPAAPPPADLPAGEQADPGVRQFEELVLGREQHPLISGLTARLERAGADPEDVVDDAELVEDLTRLQDEAARASEHHPSTHRWFRRH